MNKPNNFDNTQAGGDFTPIELGGHHAVIMSVKEQKSSTGKDMIVVALDFAKNDKQPGYFKDQFDRDTRDDKKWPFQGVQYIVTEDTDGKCSRSFKGFITSFERSNNVTTNWGDKFVDQFKGKKSKRNTMGRSNSVAGSDGFARMPKLMRHRSLQGNS